MIIRSIIFLILSFAVSLNAQAQRNEPFYSQIQPISQANVELMKDSVWHEGCPVPISDLVAINLSYIDFRGKYRIGVLIVNKSIASEVVEIFKALYGARFPIEQIAPMEVYRGNDNLSASMNNTSGFNCREISDAPGTFSIHSYGLAIDINPVQNPYVKNAKVIPVLGTKYLNRNQKLPGMIHDNSFVVKQFENRNWSWGGSWETHKDYQHFEKPRPQ